MRAKKYLWSILCVYFCYLTHGIQAIILSQNNVNFAKQWDSIWQTHSQQHMQQVLQR